MKRYFLNQFVQSASGYNPATYKSDIAKVRLLSTPAIYGDFRRRINSKDFGSDTSIEVRIKSIQFVDSNNAQVRISKQITKTGQSSETKNEIIAVSFSFVNIDLSIEERMVNPIGFQVSKYAITEENFNY